MASLPLRETPDGVVERAAERQRKKEEAEIRKLRADADLRELELSVKRGKFIPREDVYRELAARALVQELQAGGGRALAFEREHGLPCQTEEKRNGRLFLKETG